jgi:hypothetical protein
VEIKESVDEKLTVKQRLNIVMSPPELVPGDLALVLSLTVPVDLCVTAIFLGILTIVTIIRISAMVLILSGGLSALFNAGFDWGTKRTRGIANEGHI